VGVSLGYWTCDPVPPQVKDMIEGEAKQVVLAHDWWAESLNFFDPGESDGRLFGRTKIFLIGYSTADGGYQEVNPDEDCLMAYRDMCFILEKLAVWGNKHGVTWAITCVGEPIGTIVRGQWDQQLRDYVDAMKKTFPWPPEFEEKATTISIKYASRW
jgi:hypothetical protein